MKNTQTIRVQIDRKSQMMTLTSKLCQATYDPKTRKLNFIIYTSGRGIRGVLTLPDKMKTPAQPCRRSQKEKLWKTHHKYSMKVRKSTND